MKSPKPKKGDKFIALGSGEEKEWDGTKWVPTGRYPYGKDPMRLEAGSGKT